MYSDLTLAEMLKTHPFYRIFNCTNARTSFFSLCSVRCLSLDGLPTIEYILCSHVIIRTIKQHKEEQKCVLSLRN